MTAQFANGFDDCARKALDHQWSIPKNPRSHPGLSPVAFFFLGLSTGCSLGLSVAFWMIR